MFSRNNVSTVCAMWTSPSRCSWIRPNTEMGLIESAVAARAVTTYRRVGLYRSSVVLLSKTIASSFPGITFSRGSPIHTDKTPLEHPLEPSLHSCLFSAILFYSCAGGSRRREGARPYGGVRRDH